jgi:phosphate transport system protein
MPREILDNKIKTLLSEIIILDNLVEKATLDAVKALKNQDLESARRVYEGDKQINAKRFDLENDCMITIATQQPIMAGDLRLIASILEVVGELERMGDYAKGIAKICLKIGHQPLAKPLIDIPRMAEIAVSMLHRAIDSFVNSEVDYLYNQIYRDLVAVMLADPSMIDSANYLMWAAHNLERMADRVTNICERAVYVATGEMKELAPSDDETLTKNDSDL